MSNIDETLDSDRPVSPQLTVLLDLFEQAWATGAVPQIEDFVNGSASTDRRMTLEELVAIDIEYRWRRRSNDCAEPNVAWKIEDYLRVYPELGPHAPLMLVGEEYRVRRRWGDRPEHAEYRARFPELESKLTQLFREIDKELLSNLAETIDRTGPNDKSQARGSTLRVRCPHCQELLETVREGSLSEIACDACGSSFSLLTTKQDEPVNGVYETIAHFELVQRLGAGAFGEVWKARDRELDRLVAIKIPRKGQLNANDAEMFLREARAAAQLKHPNIVSIHEVGRDADRLYIVSDFVAGVTLTDWLKEQRPTARQAVELTAKIAQALHHAHEADVIHRDLKPSNIMLDGANQPHIMDFGLAKRTTGEVTMTMEGQILGTPAYMSPEQARGYGHIADRRADVYSLGVILFELLTGEHPFRGNLQMMLRQVGHEEPPGPRQLNNTISRDLDTICLKCLQKNPAKRYASSAALADDLQRSLRGEPILARPVSSAERLWRWCRRKPALAGLLVASGIVICSLVVLALVSTQWQLTRERSTRLEKENELRAAQLRAANEVAATQEYFATLSSVRERAVEREAGWAFSGLADLQKAASLDIPVVDRLALRNEAVRCLTGVDLRPVGAEFAAIQSRTHLLTFHPDGKWLAVGTLLGRLPIGVRVYAVPGGELVHDLSIPNLATLNGIRHLAFLGDVLAVTTRKGYLHRWDLTQVPAPRTAIKMPVGDITQFAFDEQGESAFYIDDSQLYRWSVSGDSEPQRILEQRVQQLTVSNDRRWLAVNRHIFDTRTGKVVQEVEVSSSTMAFSRDGRMLAVASTGNLVIVDLDSGRSIRSIKDARIDALHEAVVTHVDFAPNNSVIVTGAGDGKVKLWDISNGELVLSVPLGVENVYPAFSVDGRHMATTHNRTALIYDVNSPFLLTSTAQRTGFPRGFDLSRNPEVLACAAELDNGTRVSTWNLDNGLILDEWEVSGKPERVAAISIQEDATRLLLARPSSDAVLAWNLSSGGKAIGSLEVTKPNPISLSPGGSSFWTVSDELMINAWSLPEFKKRLQWDNAVIGNAIGNGTITSLDAGREWTIAGAKSRSVYLFHRTDAKPRLAISVGDLISSLSLSHAESHLACGTFDGNVQVSSIPAGQLVSKWKAHRDEVTSVQFTSDDQLLATASRDGSIRLWRRQGVEFQELLTLRTPGPTETVRFSEDGSRLLALISGESGIRVWDLRQIREKLHAMDLDW